MSKIEPAVPIVALLAPGAMGAAVGGRLVAHGAVVRTSLSGRSGASERRAREHGLTVVDSDAELVEGADIVLSIVPSGEAIPVAERLVPVLSACLRKPAYADCNAVAPETARRVGEIIAPTGCAFADVAIFGLPPTEERGPTYYACGEGATAFARLGDFGLRVKPVESKVGSVSMLKLIHAGMSKGTAGVVSAMILVAMREGIEVALLEQLHEGHPPLAAWVDWQMPLMFGKAYRWVNEMKELSEFVDQGTPSADIYRSLSELYGQLATIAEEAGPTYERFQKAVTRTA